MPAPAMLLYYISRSAALNGNSLGVPWTMTVLESYNHRIYEMLWPSENIQLDSIKVRNVEVGPGSFDRLSDCKETLER